MWFKTIDKEIELLQTVHRGNLISRIKPLDYADLSQDKLALQARPKSISR